MPRIDHGLLPGAASLVDILRWRAEKQPEEVAYTWLRDGEEVGAELSYRELSQRAQSIVAVLQTCTEPGDRALLLYPPGLEFVTAFFASLYAGLINVPTYPPQVGRRNQSLERARTIARLTDPLILTSSKMLAAKEKLATEAPELAPLEWIVYDVQFLRPGSLPKTTSGKLRRYLCRKAYLAGEYPASTG